VVRVRTHRVALKAWIPRLKGLQAVDLLPFHARRACWPYRRSDRRI